MTATTTNMNERLVMDRPDWGMRGEVRVAWRVITWHNPKLGVDITSRYTNKDTTKVWLCQKNKKVRSNTTNVWACGNNNKGKSNTTKMWSGVNKKIGKKGKTRISFESNYKDIAIFTQVYFQHYKNITISSQVLWCWINPRVWFSTTNRVGEIAPITRSSHLQGRLTKDSVACVGIWVAIIFTVV